MHDVIEVVRIAERGAASAAREAALASFEAEAAHLHGVFARDQLGRVFTVTLAGIAAESRMPTRRVVWTQSFTDDLARDDFLAGWPSGWNAERSGAALPTDRVPMS